MASRLAESGVVGRAKAEQRPPRGAVGVVYGIGNREEKVANRSERVGGECAAPNFRITLSSQAAHAHWLDCSLPLPGNRMRAVRVAGCRAGFSS